MNTFVNIRSAPGVALQAEAHTFVNTRIHAEPALTRDSGQLVGASGVVGFWRVKDEPKGVLIAEASASARYIGEICLVTAQEITGRQQIDNKQDTEGEHSGNRRGTNQVDRACGFGVPNDA